MKKVVVLEAFSFVGFHVVNKFLDEGIEVIGVDQVDTDVKDEMQLCIGRNSHFHLQADDRNLGEVDIIVACFCEEKNYQSYDEWIHQSPSIVELHTGITPFFQSSNRIKLPTLYGPWQHTKEKMEEENIIYIDDAITYIYEKVTQFLINQRIEDTAIPAKVSIEIGKKQIEEHERKFKHLYKS